MISLIVDQQAQNLNRIVGYSQNSERHVVHEPGGLIGIIGGKNAIIVIWQGIHP